MPSDSIGLLEIVKAWRDQGVEVTCMSGLWDKRLFNIIFHF